MSAPSVRIAQVRFDADCQSRVSLDEETVAEYAHRMREGAVFPSIVVFFDGSDHWLADGFHRWAAAKSLARERGDEATAEIAADVRQGARLDAVRHALAANAAHGKRREPGDYRKGYEIAVRVGLCEAEDTAQVRTLLACSERWARDLTAAARAKADREREARIVAARQAGETQQRIAEREGVNPARVSRVEADYAKRQTAELHNPAPAPRPAPTYTAPADPMASLIRPAPAPQPTEREPMRPVYVQPVQPMRQPEPAPEPLRQPEAPPLREKLAIYDTPMVQHWSDLLYALEKALTAIHRAAPHPCSAPMVPRATALRRDVLRALNNLNVEASDDDAA